MKYDVIIHEPQRGSNEYSKAAYCVADSVENSVSRSPDRMAGCVGKSVGRLQTPMRSISPISPIRTANSKTRQVTGTVTSLTRQNLASMNDDIVEHD